MAAARSLHRALLLALTFLSLLGGIEALPSFGTCKNPVIRKEWGSLTKPERRDYIRAVLCLQRKPSQLPSGLVPGARNRFDDFATTHINSTLRIHFNGVFLAWHRNFVWLWETALRDECGYAGVQPYWDWPLWQSRGPLARSPLFDGSDTSLGGDGYPDNSRNCTPLQAGVCVPKGAGGGCMKDGPFKHTVASMGPFAFDGSANTTLPANWTTYSPHCISRDLNDRQYKYMDYRHYNSVLAQTDIASFQRALTPLNSGPDVGLHGNGHFVIGSSMFDFFASPFDPAFFLHHGAIDRLWTQWQERDAGARTYGSNALNGTYSLFDAPTTPPVTFDTVIEWGFLGRSKTMRELMSPKRGGFCYRYEN